MSDDTKIEWCDSTFNPWIGCTKVGPGCDHCYAEADFDLRKHRVTWGAGNARSRTSKANWQKPLQWDRKHTEFFAQHGRRRRVFCASLADAFDNEVPVEWRADLFALIQRTPCLDWLLLTKRIGNARALLPEAVVEGEMPSNVRLGATICNQAEAERDIPKLLRLGIPNFLSIEPMLGPIDLERPRPGPDMDQGNGQMICQPWLIQSGIDWVIAGGESGPHARPVHPDWVRSLRDQCKAAGVPFLFKQWGEWVPMMGHAEGVSVRGPKFTHTDGRIMGRAGKASAGRLLDGVPHDGYPVRP